MTLVNNNKSCGENGDVTLVNIVSFADLQRPEHDALCYGGASAASTKMVSLKYILNGDKYQSLMMDF